MEGTFPSVLLLGHGTANEQHAGHNALRACEERLCLWMESPDEEQLLFTLNLSRSGNVNHVFLSPLITVLKTKPSSDTHANDVFVHRLLRLRSGDCPGRPRLHRQAGDPAGRASQFWERSLFKPLAFKCARRSRTHRPDPPLPTALRPRVPAAGQLPLGPEGSAPRNRTKRNEALSSARWKRASSVSDSETRCRTSYGDGLNAPEVRVSAPRGSTHLLRPERG